MDLTTRQLEQFVAVAAEEHVGRAAERLHMSQPPLTQAIQRLERSLGVELLARTGRNVRLTPAGRSFARDAAALLDSQQAAVDRTRRVAAGLLGTVRIGCVGSLAFGFIPQVLRDAAAELPDVRLDLAQGPSAGLLGALGRRELDIAVVRAASVHDDGLTVRPVHAERLRLAVPRGHPLARRRRVRIADLRAESFVAFAGARVAGDEDALRDACAAAGFVPRVVAEAVDLPGLLAWVMAGRALALVPEQAVAIAGPDVVLLEVTGAGDTLRIGFVAASLADHDTAVARVLDLMGGAAGPVRNSAARPGRR